MGVPRSRPGAPTAWGGSSPSLAALARLGAGARYAKLWGGALSPTSRQHAYKSAVLALGLPSYPPPTHKRVEHGAIIAIPTAVRRTMHFGGRARAIFMRGRRDGNMGSDIGVLGTSCVWIAVARGAARPHWHR